MLKVYRNDKIYVSLGLGIDDVCKSRRKSCVWDLRVYFEKYKKGWVVICG